LERHPGRAPEGKLDRADPPRRSEPLIASTVGGAAFGCAAMVISALLAIWMTGYVRAFADNRGFLQLVLAVPVASATTAACLAYFRGLSPRQMLWSLLPFEVLILVGAGGLEIEYRAWPWVVAASGAVGVPWLLGLLAGSAGRRRRTSG